MHEKTVQINDFLIESYYPKIILLFFLIFLFKNIFYIKKIK